MRKEFDSTELARWFSDNYECWWCGKNHWDAFHHIDPSGDYSDSLLNAAPLNNFECHLPIHSKLRKQECIKVFMKKTLVFLLERSYKFKEIDKKFMEQHYNIYKDIYQDNAIRHEQDSPKRQHR